MEGTYQAAVLGMNKAAGTMEGGWTLGLEDLVSNSEYAYYEMYNLEEVSISAKAQD